MSRKLLALASVCLAAAFIAATPLRHLNLVASFPPEGSTLIQPPERLLLWFNQEPDLAVSRVELEGPAGEVPVGDAAPTRWEKSFAVPVEGDMPYGAYEIHWQTAGDDGHVIRRSFGFTLSRD